MTPIIDELLLDHVPGHSIAQMDWFVTGANGITPYGCYRQALREIATRVDSILSDKLAEASAEVDAIEAEAERHPFNRFARARAAIRAKQARESIRRTAKSRADRERELRRFVEKATALRKMLLPLTPDAVAIYEAEFWIERVSSFCAADLIATGELSRSTVATVSAMPPTARAEVLARIAPVNREALRNWYATIEPALPEVPSATIEALEEIRCLSPR